jgi:hypothetical protein
LVEAVNHIKSSAQDVVGIECSEGVSLSFTGDSLEVIGGRDAPGIGAEWNTVCSAISLEGGTYVVQGNVGINTARGLSRLAKLMVEWSTVNASIGSTSSNGMVSEVTIIESRVAVRVTQNGIAASEKMTLLGNVSLVVNAPPSKGGRHSQL